MTLKQIIAPVQSALNPHQTKKWLIKPEADMPKVSMVHSAESSFADYLTQAHDQYQQAVRLAYKTGIQLRPVNRLPYPDILAS